MSESSTDLVAWVEQAVRDHLPDTAQETSLQWQRLTGDAGFRQYFRLNTQPATLAVVAPPATENSRAFVDIATYLREQGVHAPRIIARDFDRGYLLIEDLGRDLLLDHLNADTVEALYGEALMSLLRLQQLPIDGRIFPPYSRDKLRQELELFREWFVSKLLGHNLDEREHAMLDRVFTRLEDSALEQPEVIVHRDFHSRNLIHIAGGAPGVIDFQDAVAGPLTYDLVSLLRDCYVQWPAEQVRGWALAYGGMAADVGLVEHVEEATFLRWFDWMGLQRHIKVLGVFARLSLRDDKHGYLADLPRVVSYVRAVARGYPELADFVQWFDHELQPQVERQRWYAACPKGVSGS